MEDFLNDISKLESGSLKHNYIEVVLVETDTRSIVMVYLPNECVFRVIDKDKNSLIKEYKRFTPAYDSIRGCR